MIRRPRLLLLAGAVLIGIVICAFSLNAKNELSADDDPVRLFAEGNEAYESGDYAGAVLLYKRALDGGKESASLHYNLGNAYLKLGELGEAVASYRRAERLAPRDRDVRENLELARARRIDIVREKSISPIGSLRDGLRRVISLRELLFIADGFYYAAVLLLIVGIVRGWPPGRWRPTLLVLGTLACLFLAFLGMEWWYRSHAPEAVLVSPQSEARSGPGQEYTSEFTVHEGTEVVVEDCREGWCVVHLGGELRGWVKQEDLEFIEGGMLFDVGA